MIVAGNLSGRRVLVVEDEMLIAANIEDLLLGLGCVVVGPVGKLDAAIAAATTEILDAAILDVTIRGGAVFPVAAVLDARGIPFAFASGYGAWALPEAAQGRPRIMKPFTREELETQLRSLLGEGPPPAIA